MQTPEFTYYLVENSKIYHHLMQDLQLCNTIVIDTETNGLNPYNGDTIIGIAFYFPEMGVGYYLPSEVDFDLGEITLRDVYPLTDKLYIMYNAKFDLHMLHQAGFETPDYVEDVMIAAHLANENETLSCGAGSYRLKDLAAFYLGEWAIEGEDKLEENAEKLGLDPKKEMWKLPVEDVYYYAIMDTVITWELREFYMPVLARWNQIDLYHKRNVFNTIALFEMEKNGILIDNEVLDDIQLENEVIIADIKGTLNYAALPYFGVDKKGEPTFNPNSPQQIVRFFQEVAGVTIPNAQKATLEVLSERGDKWAELFLHYKIASKANNTFFEPYKRLQGSDGKLHPQINAARTRTGRLSSSNPNLQQVPRKGKYGVKKVFVPSPGYVLVQTDYSNLELRLAVHYAQEETMRALYDQDVDVHSHTAKLLRSEFQRDLVDYSMYSSEEDAVYAERNYAKSANFGLLYGMGAWRRDPNKPSTAEKYFVIGQEEAQELVETWRALYPNFMAMYNSCQSMARETRPAPAGGDAKYQYIQLPINGRTRKYHPYNYDAGVGTPFYTAWNFLIQGTAAAVCEESITHVAEQWRGNDDVRLLLTVHDSLIYEVREGVADEIIPIIGRQMVEVFDGVFNPVLAVETEVSTVSWYDLEEYEEGMFS